MLGLLLVHVTFLFVALTGYIVGTSVMSLSPILSTIVLLSNVTEVTVADTLTVAVAVIFPSTVVAVIVAVPPPVALTTPAVTVATAGSLVVQITFLLLALAGAIVGTSVAVAPPKVKETLL